MAFFVWILGASFLLNSHPRPHHDSLIAKKEGAKEAPFVALLLLLLFTIFVLISFGFLLHFIHFHPSLFHLFLFCLSIGYFFVYLLSFFLSFLYFFSFVHLKNNLHHINKFLIDVFSYISYSSTFSFIVNFYFLFFDTFIFFIHYITFDFFLDHRNLFGISFLFC